MKNLTLKLFSLVSIALVVLLFGCSKTKTSENAGKKDSPMDLQKIESVVKYCTDRVLNPLKTNDSIPFDSLNYYLEATANYTHGIASANGELQKIDSNFFKVPLKNNKIAMTDVDSIYTILIDSIRASFYRISLRNKNLVSTMVSTVDKQTDIITFKVTSVILYGNHPQFGGFDTTDYWTYRGAATCTGGKCGPYYGSGDPCMDAAVKIQNAVMLRKGLLSGCYVPPLTDVPLWPFNFPNQSWNPADGYNYFRYLLFLNSPSYANSHDCLMPFEMNRYLDLAEYCVYTVQPSGAKPSDGSSFISIQLHGSLIVGGGLAVHMGTCYYGMYLQGGYQTPL